MLKTYTIEPTHGTQTNGDHRDNEEAAGSFVWRGPTLEQTWKEIQRQGYLGSPMVATNMLWFARYMVSTAFLGKLGGLELAAGTLALTFSNIAGWSVLIGLASGMEAIFSQAYGAGKHEVLGPTLKRGFAVLLMASIPVAVLWCKAEGLLLLTGQAPLLCKEAQRYLYYLLPDLLATCFIAPLRIFLRSQCITKPLVLCSVLALCLHIPLNYLLVLKLGMGAPGTAAAICVTDFALAGLLIVYLVHFHLGRPINGHSFAQFFRIHVDSATERALSWRALLKLALPCCLMTCMEGWCYEIIVLLTGFLPQAKEAVETVAIVLNGDTIFYAMEVALASCVSARVGNELGAKRPVKAYQATVAALWVSMVLGFGGAGWLMLSSRMAWGRCFTKDVKVLKNVAEILPIMAFIELANFPQNVACGALRGSARQTVGALINFAAFYVIGIPLAILLGFKFKLGLLGLWIGLATAAAITAILGITVVLRTDWGFQTIRAEELTNQQILSAQESSRKDNPELYATVPQGDSLSMDSSYPEDIYDGDSKITPLLTSKAEK
ncbi:hypothetical protein KP509_19G073200 [Ceratopteris richardii]|uniref:Protein DETOXIFICATION n=1 Tax=Ceratopteris richardii TaxID=49495 RepID=A0A8T2SPR9_CERRI|nr:hypothetical protein KP509_19G073200 [Ceratopteris richardii]